jgi:TPP-dependent pyruvate/acetoin dehydrogenase alpha subunit
MNNKIKFQIYKNLLKIRLIENKIAQEYPSQKMRCPVHLSIGQEAIAAPLDRLFKKRDIVVSGHRAHSHYLGKGGDIKKFIDELHGKESGFSRGKAGSMHLYDKNNGFYGSSPIVANIIPVGVGIALSNKLKKNNKTVIIFFGDAATEEGVFYESLNFAAIHNLRIIFVCENNLYSVYSNLNSRQAKNRNISVVAKSLKVNSIRAYGNNIDSTIKAFEYAKSHFLKKKKPILIEFETYRFIEHCGPYNDDHLNYRKKNEVNKWKKKDPISILFKNLNKNQKNSLNKYSCDLTKKIDKLFLESEAAKFPKQSIAFEGLFEK